jgi:hypothetical protein
MIPVELNRPTKQAYGQHTCDPVKEDNNGCRDYHLVEFMRLEDAGVENKNTQAKRGD